MVVGGWVVSLCLHEFAHAYAAYRAGDHSVEAAGYLTLNPFKYAHPLLSIVLPLLFIVQGGIGLPGGAVYLHPHAFRSQGRASVAAAAGPLVNVVFAAVILALVHAHASRHPHQRFWAGLAFLGFLQVSAAVLNLLPIPGLDGYAIIEPLPRPARPCSGAEGSSRGACSASSCCCRSSRSTGVLRPGLRHLRRLRRAAARRRGRPRVVPVLAAPTALSAPIRQLPAMRQPTSRASRTSSLTSKFA